MVRLIGGPWWAATVVLIVVTAVVLALAAGRADSDDGTAPDTAEPANLPAPSPAEPGGSTPTSPVRACDSAALDGPAEPPAGAVEVSTEEDLADLVRERDNETTYWLAPGTHHLGRDMYEQVMPHAG